MLSTDIEAFGVVREPGQAPYPAFAVAVAQPGAVPWVVYRRPAAFRVRLRLRLRLFERGVQLGSCDVRPRRRPAARILVWCLLP